MSQPTDDDDRQKTHYDNSRMLHLGYLAVALSVDGVSAAGEFYIVAVSSCVKSADVNARGIAVGRRPMRITRALMIVASTAVLRWCVVETETVHE